MKNWTPPLTLVLTLSCSAALAEQQDTGSGSTATPSQSPAASSDEAGDATPPPTGEAPPKETGENTAPPVESLQGSTAGENRATEDSAQEVPAASTGEELNSEPSNDADLADADNAADAAEKIFEAPEAAERAAPTPLSSENEPSAEPATPNAPTEPSDDEAALELPGPKQGHFVAFALGYGVATARDSERGWRKFSAGPGFNLRLGESLAPWVDLGLDLHFAMTSGEEKLTLGRITAHAQFYPFPKWFVRPGFGFGFAGGPDPKFDDFERFGFGDVYHLGVGRQFYLTDDSKSGGFILSPVATFEIAPDKDFGTGSLWLGLEISWWSGLARDKLALPTADAYRREDDD